MSDRLIVEFYDPEDRGAPVACVLAFHGGDNPSSAATTLSDFFDHLSRFSDPGLNDAGLLASRFVVWESRKGTDSCDFTDVRLVSFREAYGYQIARVYPGADRPHVQMVRDQWTTEEELREAEIILGQTRIEDPPEAA
jgi:hypothetical protein